MNDRQSARQVAQTAVLSVYTASFLAYSAWLFYRMVSRFTDEEGAWILEPVGILLLAEMGVDEILERFYEKGKVSQHQHWWSMMFNFAFFTSFRLYLDAEAWTLVEDAGVTVLHSWWSLAGLGGLLVSSLWYWTLPERAEGFIRLP